MSTPEFHKAFLEAQRAMPDPTKDASNPHFKSRFVSLRGICDAVRPALHDNDITASQAIDFEGEMMFVRTVLMHTSGGFIESRCPVLAVKKNDPQALGSAITYSRRYALASICGVAPSDEDDDGARASQGARDRKPARKLQPYDSVDFAITEMQQARTPAALRAVGERVKASGFKGDDIAAAKECYAQCQDNFEASKQGAN